MRKKWYQKISKLVKAESKSISEIFHESILDRLDKEFSSQETALIEKGRSEYRQRKSTNWRSIRRD